MLLELWILRTVVDMTSKRLPQIIHSPLIGSLFIYLISLEYSLKIAVITPIYKDKNTDQHQFVNYRPVSLLPTLSKIMEKVVHKPLDNYMTKNELFNSSKYVFRENHSTEFSTIEILDKIANQIDKIPFLSSLTYHTHLSLSYTVDSTTSLVIAI